MKSKEEIIAAYDRENPSDPRSSGITITGIDLSFGNIVLISLKIAVVWAVLGGIAWAVYAAFG